MSAKIALIALENTSHLALDFQVRSVNIWKLLIRCFYHSKEVNCCFFVEVIGFGSWICFTDYNVSRFADIFLIHGSIVLHGLLEP